MLIKTKLEWLIDITEEMKRCYGISLTKKQANYFVKACLQNASIETCGFDTCAREYVGHLIGEEVTGMDWPCGGDTKEYTKQFFIKLRDNAKVKGYKIDMERYKEYLDA